MLGIIAEFLRQKKQKKVLVVVPTTFLHAYQSNNYCPTASKVPEEMSDPTIKDIFYTSFDRFVAPEFPIPEDALVLVDEFHELFFD